jgi:hypothetical protein
MPRARAELIAMTHALYEELHKSKFTSDELIELGKCIYSGLEMQKALDKKRLTTAIIMKLFRAVEALEARFEPAPTIVEKPVPAATANPQESDPSATIASAAEASQAVDPVAPAAPCASPTPTPATTPSPSATPKQAAAPSPEAPEVSNPILPQASPAEPGKPSNGASAKTGETPEIPAGSQVGQSAGSW